MDENPYEPPKLSSLGSAQKILTARGWTELVGLIVACMVGLFILWALDIAGFHHDRVVGLFGWLFINGEDPNRESAFYFRGEEYWPTWTGLPITLAATCGLILLARYAFRRLDRW
jgi:hypothetical protein